MVRTHQLETTIIKSEVRGHALVIIRHQAAIKPSITINLVIRHEPVNETGWLAGFDKKSNLYVFKKKNP